MIDVLLPIAITTNLLYPEGIQCSVARICPPLFCSHLIEQRLSKTLFNEMRNGVVG